MLPHKLYICTIYFAIILKCTLAAEEDAIVWQWSCEDGRCIKKLHEDNPLEPGLSLEACKMFCDDFGLLWPRPTGITQLGSFLSKINIEAIDILPPKRSQSDSLVEAAVKRFKESISRSIPEDVSPKATGKAVNIYLVNKKPHVRGNPEIDIDFTLNVDDEGYRIKVESSVDNKINATIIGNSFFGLRHGLETLSQLILYDEVRDHLLMVRDVVIEDRPVYTYRGILLDTARNYYSIESIRRTIDAMATVKLNTFHWHITDSQSFPFVSDRRPELARRGAYSPRKIYTKEMIKELVEYGRERGVRVLPEFDAPAHVGEGWQKTNLTVCFKAEPWSNFCVEPPCGQLNPIRDELYNYLEDIYFDMADSFSPDIFHMGGDEVSEKCWNSSEEIQNYMVQNRWGLEKSSFLKLWNYFQQKAQDRVYKAFGKRLPLILWTSTLTDYSHVEKFLNKDEYIIQVWTTGGDPQIKGLLQKGYKLIMSNYDALYMDCGFGAWVGSGNNWCSPYIGWQKVYDNSPAQIAQQFKDQILGGEAALWSEQADEFTLDGRLWPRAAALAERLWAEPDATWQEAEHRMLQVRERLVRMGVSAESIQPEWCYQNEGFCYR